MDVAPDPALAAESRVPQIIAGAVIPSILGSIFVVGRLFSRRFTTRNLGYDDACLLVAFFGNIILMVMNIIFTKLGAGHHIWVNTNPLHMALSMKLEFANQLIYPFTLFVTKLGLCLFYGQIFQDLPSKWLVYSITAFLVVAFVPLELVVVFRCSPVSDAWSIFKTATKTANCWTIDPLVCASSATNIAGDLFLMAFILPRFISLKLPRLQKISLIGIVCLGLVVVAAAAVRLARVLNLGNSVDYTWESYDVTTWTSIEVNAGLICASAPCIRPLIRKVAPGFMSPNLRTESGPAGHHTGGKVNGHGPGARRVGLGILGDEEAVALDSQNNDDFLAVGNSPKRPSDTVLGGKDKSNRRTSGGAVSYKDMPKEPRRAANIFKAVSITVRGASERKGEGGGLGRKNSFVRF